MSKITKYNIFNKRWNNFRKIYSSIYQGKQFQIEFFWYFVNSSKGITQGKYNHKNFININNLKTIDIKISS